MFFFYNSKGNEMVLTISNYEPNFVEKSCGKVVFYFWCELLCCELELIMGRGVATTTLRKMCSVKILRRTRVEVF